VAIAELELGGGELDSVGGLGPRSFWGVMMMMVMMMMIQGDKLQFPAVRQEERRLFQRAYCTIHFRLVAAEWVVLIRGVCGLCEHVAGVPVARTQPPSATKR
jgi:hypothetical protein